MPRVCSRICVEHLGAERVRRQHAGAVARVDAGLLDVLHDAADPDVARRRRARRRRPRSRSPGSGRGRSRALGRSRRVALEVVAPGRRGSRRSPSRGRRARSDGRTSSGKPTLVGGVQRLVDRVRGRVRRRLEARAGRAASPKRPRSSARSIASTLVPEDRDAGLVQAGGELQRRLAAELHDDALGLLDLDDAEHVLERQRLEVQAVGGVVVGRDRLRVAVDHHRVAAGLADGHRRVHAAVVELDALADAVRARRRGSRPTALSPRTTSWAALRSQPE